MELAYTWHLKDAAQLPATASIASATHAQSYLLLRLAPHGAVLLAESAVDPALHEVPDSEQALRADDSVTTCCLYEDTSAWLAGCGIEGTADAVRKHQA